MLGEAGIEYVAKRLRSGGPLGKALESVDPTAGIARIFLPNEWPDIPQRLEDEPGGLPKDGLRRIRQATKDKIMAHFAASESRGWAMIEDAYGVGLGAFVNARIDGRETRFKAAWTGGPTILYLAGAAGEVDVEDFLNAALDHGIVSVLGIGGPLSSVEAGSLDWDGGVLPHLAEHVRLIMNDAFDAQALVFWERTSD
ncbi:MAG: hypothetical protein ACRDHC_04915 [Actinomycetota bacterium]